MGSENLRGPAVAARMAPLLALAWISSSALLPENAQHSVLTPQALHESGSQDGAIQARGSRG